MTQKIFVTGADGFIGRHLCAHLESRGFDVTRATRLRGTGADGRCVETGDLAECDRLAELVAGHDVIVHLAGRAHVLRETVADPELAFRRANVDASARLAEAAVKAGVRRFVFLSTIGVHGDRSSHPLTERDAPAPLGPYANSKLLAEEALRRIDADGALGLVVLRPTLAYGPNCPGNMARLFRLVARGIPLPFATISARRSLVGIDNLIDVIELAMSHPAALGQTFLVADGTDLTLSELLRHIAHGLGLRARLYPFPRALLAMSANLVGKRDAFEKLTASLTVDVSKTRERLGWSPRVPVAEGLEAAARSFMPARTA